MSTCEGPDCTHPMHHVHQTAKKIVESINESDEAEKAVDRDLKKELAFLIARERAAARPLTVAEAQGLEAMNPESREEYLEERAKKYKAAVNLSPRDCFTGEFTVNTATAGQVINIAVSALRKIGGGSGLGAKLEARQALMQMQKICEENKMIPRAPENKSIESPAIDEFMEKVGQEPEAPAVGGDADGIGLTEVGEPKLESSSEEKEPAPQADDASAPEPQQGGQ